LQNNKKQAKQEG